MERRPEKKGVAFCLLKPENRKVGSNIWPKEQ